MSYFAFLSYSRQDAKVAKRLHAKLDAYRVPQGTTGPHATGRRNEPRRLHPIFLDQTDLQAGGSLTQRITAALAASEKLIVLCSPSAATSKWVDLEVQAFLSAHTLDHVVPVISASAPIDVDIEAQLFPPSLRGHDLLAADLRREESATGTVGDGHDLGVMKVIAALLEVPLDSMLQRERARQRKRLAWLSGATVAFGVTAVLAVVFGLRSNQLAAQERELRSTAEAKSKGLTDAVMLFKELLAEQADPKQRISMPPMKLVAKFRPYECADEDCTAPRELPLSSFTNRHRQYFNLLREAYTAHASSPSNPCFGSCRVDCNAESSPFYTITRDFASCPATAEAARDLNEVAVFRTEAAGRSVLGFQLRSMVWGRGMGGEAFPIAFLVRERSNDQYVLAGAAMYVGGLQKDNTKDDGYHMDTPNVVVRWLATKRLPDIISGEEWGYAASSKDFRYSLHRFDPNFGRYSTFCLAKGEYDDTSPKWKVDHLANSASMSSTDCSLDSLYNEDTGAQEPDATKK